MMRSLLRFFTVLIVTGLVCFGNIMPAAAQVETTNITDSQQELGELIQKAFEATNEGKFPAAENVWTEIIEKFPDQAAAWSNRGNSRVSQNKLEPAISDYEKAMELAVKFKAPLPASIHLNQPDDETTHAPVITIVAGLFVPFKPLLKSNKDVPLTVKLPLIVTLQVDATGVAAPCIAV